MASSNQSPSKPLPPKIPPDYLIKRRVKINDKLHAADAYVKDLVRGAGNTHWFESKIKYDFQDNEKRNCTQMEKELQEANRELKLTRNHRLKLLFESETRQYEAELREKGLGVVRSGN